MADTLPRNHSRATHSPMRRRILAALIAAGGSALLPGCMLSSGRQISTDIQQQAGNTRVSFLSAEGEELVSLPVSTKFTNYEVIAIVTVESGELQLDVYDGSGIAAISIQGRPSQQVTRSAKLVTNEQGQLRYRVTARGARNGGFQILYRRQQL